MMAISASRPLAFRVAQPVSAIWGSRSAITTFAPASASASAQASPIPWPAPVTTAVFWSSLNFSRYMLLFFLFVFRRSSRRAIRSCLDDAAILVEAVQAGRTRRKPHTVARFQDEFSDAACREHSQFPRVDIKESVAAQMFGDRYGPRPALALFDDF